MCFSSGISRKAWSAAVLWADPAGFSPVDDKKGKWHMKTSIVIRLTAALASLLAASVCLTACNGGGNPGSESGQSSGLEAEKGKKLTFMLPAFDYQDDTKFENQVLKEFQEKYPDIELELVTASIDNWMVRLRTSMASNDPIDVFQDSANNNPMYALRGINQPLQDYIDMSNPNLHMETMDTVFCYNGNYYVAVTEPDPCVIFYNKEIFENEGVDSPQELYEAGEWNFDSLTRIAKELTYSDNSGKRWGLACNYPYLFFGANATSMVKLDENYHYTLNINDPNLLTSLEVIQDAWYTSQWQGWESNPWSTFYSGSAAMLADFKWTEQNIIEAQEYGLCDFEYGVVPMATGPNNPDGLTPMTAFGYAMGNGCDTPYHSGILIDMLTNAEAANNAENYATYPEEHLALYEELSNKLYPINSYDSAVGGAFEICQAIGTGQSIPQAIAEYTPIYQQKVDEANGVVTGES